MKEQVSVKILLELLNDKQIIKRIKDITREMLKTAAATDKADSKIKQFAVTEGKASVASAKLTKHQKKLERQVKKLTTANQKLTNSQKKQNKSIGSLLGKFTQFRWALVNVYLGVAVLTGAFRLLILPSIELEEALVGVAKTTGLTKDEMKDMKDELKRLSLIIPMTVMDLADIAKVAGQLGIKKDDIGKFTKSIAMISEVTDLTAEEAATNMAKLSNAFDIPIERVMVLGDVVNELENTTAATAAGLITSLTRVGAAASALGVDFETTSAALATLISAGMGAERAGTRLRTLFTRMSQNIEKFAGIADMEVGKFKQLMQDDATGALVKVVEGMDKTISTTGDMASAFDAGGRVAGFALITLATNLEDFTANMETANEQNELGTSVLNEMSRQVSTTAAQWQLFSNQIFGDTETIGSVLRKGLVDPLIEMAKIKMGKAPTIVTFLKVRAQLKKDIEEGVFTKAQGENIFEAFNRNVDEGNLAGAILVVQEFTEQFKKVNETIKETTDDEPEILTFYDNIGDALQGYIDKVKKVEEARLGGDPKELLDAYADLADEVVKITESFTEGGKELKVIRDLTADIGIGTDKIVDNTADILKNSKNIAEFGLSIFNKTISAEVKELESDYKKLTKTRLIGETAQLDNLHDIELAIKREKLAQLELTDAVSGTNEELEKDSYTAWVETVNQFIKSAIENGNLLGSNVSQSIKQYQTLLLSSSKFSSKTADEETTALEELEKQREIAQLKYKIGVGEERYQLEQFIKEIENEGSTQESTADKIKRALTNKKLAIDDLTKSQQDMAKMWDEVTRAVKAQELGLSASTLSALTDIDLQKSAVQDLIREHERLARISNSGNIAGSNITRTSGNTRTIDFEGGGGVRITDTSYERPGSYKITKADGSIIWRTHEEFAQGGLITQPTMALMGERGPEMVVPLTGPNAGKGADMTINIESVNVTGIAGDPNTFAYEFAKELRRELRTL